MGASLQTHYDTLGVERHASPEQVRTAYRRRAQACHPDKLADAVEVQDRGQALMVQINQAYAVLSDPSGRAAYDRWVDAHEQLLAAQRAVAAASHPGARASWPWYLLSATMAFTMLAVGTVLYKEAVPAVVAPPDASGQSTAATLSRPDHEASGSPAAPRSAPARGKAGDR